MTIFESVKTAVHLKDAAERYGIKVMRGDMICCPFHKDRHPSMKLNQSYFYCFGCGEYGDVIDFVGKLLGIKPIDAAKRMAADFGIEGSSSVAGSRMCRKIDTRSDLERDCFRVLCDYLHILKEWKIAYAPKMSDEDCDDRFVEACKMLDYIEYLVDFFINEDIEDRVKAVNVLIMDGTIGKLQEKIERMRDEQYEQYKEL